MLGNSYCLETMARLRYRYGLPAASWPPWGCYVSSNVGFRIQHRRNIAMRIAIVAAGLVVAGWADVPPAPPQQPPQPGHQYRVLTPPPQPYRPQLPMGPAQGSIERCLQIQSRGGLSC